MYFPYIRGRQYELLALRELVKNNLLGSNVIPIVEPVKLSPTLINVMNDYIQANHPIAIIRNPMVGVFESDLERAKENSKEAVYKKQYLELCDDKIIKKSIIMQQNANEILSDWRDQGVDFSDILVINDDRDYLDLYDDFFENAVPKYVLIPDESAFRRKVRHHKVLLDDKFDKQERNKDYKEKDDCFFSDDHLYFGEEGFVGFSDYSIIGKEFQEAGFAPYAVAIHIVYFTEKKILRVRHFVSDSNDDITNPALKFYEAVSKLVEWYNNDPTPMAMTYGLHTLLNFYEQQSYPGLGTIKKLSLMHHLELMGKYLNEG